MDERGEIDEATRDVAGQWSSGSLYEDSNDILRLEFPEDSEDEAGNVLMFLLSTAGGLKVRLFFHRYLNYYHIFTNLHPLISANEKMTRSSAFQMCRSPYT